MSDNKYFLDKLSIRNNKGRIANVDVFNKRITWQEKKETARRIVACLNACEGFDIETIEEANERGITMKDTISDLVKELLNKATE